MPAHCPAEEVAGLRSAGVSIGRAVQQLLDEHQAGVGTPGQGQGVSLASVTRPAGHGAAVAGPRGCALSAGLRVRAGPGATAPGQVAPIAVIEVPGWRRPVQLLERPLVDLIPFVSAPTADATVAALSDGPHGLSVGLTVAALGGSPADALVAVVEDGLRRLAKQIHRTDTAGPASTAVGLDRAVAPGWR